MTVYKNEGVIVNEVIKKVGKKIVLAAPLGAGKPNHVINAFYKKAKEDPSISLTICTALTLQRPKGKSDLECRFINLFEERIFGDYPDLEYELDRMSDNLPDNIQVIEFYFAPGKYIKNDLAQMNYVSSNYTHVVRDVMDRHVNVVTQMVSSKEVDGKKFFSLSSNPDTTADLVNKMKEENQPLVMIGQVNQNMPFLFGDALVEEEFFDYVVDDPKKYYQVFGPPKMSVSDADYMIGLYSSMLVRDDGEIQIGIGSLGDATIYGLVNRQVNNDIYNDLIRDLTIREKFGDIINRVGDTGVFDKGLFGASEMIVDGFMHLYKNGIIKKRVYDDIALQRLLNSGVIKEELSADILKILWEEGVIHERIDEADFNYLQKWGIIKQEVFFRNGHIHIDDYQSIIPHLSDQANMVFLQEHCLGQKLKNGQVMHGGFFLGPQSFYQWLRELPEEEIKMINMKSVQKINQLYGHEELDRLHRKNARFINTCMMYTLAGAAVSDGLEDGKVVSGVGGQYNFVAMAQELPDGHSILNLRSTRLCHGKLLSNIVPHYGHMTIPRHLRDIVITEYGIAFIRGLTDQEMIIELLKITDSRFQKELMSWAKKVGKLDPKYELPIEFKNNYSESYTGVLKKYKKLGFFSPFPFGTELTDDEIKLGKALKLLKADLDDKPKFIKTLLKSFFARANNGQLGLLAKMKLDKPQNVKERIYKQLLIQKLT